MERLRPFLSLGMCVDILCGCENDAVDGGGDGNTMEEQEWMDSEQAVVAIAATASSLAHPSALRRRFHQSNQCLYNSPNSAYKTMAILYIRVTIMYMHASEERLYAS